MFSLKAHWAIVSGILLLIIIGAAAYTTLEKEVTLRDDGKSIKISTFASNVKQFLEKENIALEDGDVVIPDLETKLNDGMQIIIKRAFPVKIKVDGKDIIVKTQPNTVANLIKTANIELGEMDKVQPDLTKYISKEQEIIITRVEQRITTRVCSIPYETVTRKDDSLPFGEKRIVQKGEDGQEEVKIIEILEDGKVVEKNTETREIKAPKPQIVLTGTVQVASRGGKDFSYTEKRRMLATAYTHTGNPTATGTMPRVGVVAVDPKVIPLGTQLYVEGYGFAKAEDTGGAIKGDRIDIFLETEEETVQFGRRWVDVYILK